MVELGVPHDLPAYVLRGAKGGAPLLFLPGMCSHPLGYAQSFQFAASEHGVLLTLQGDVPCGGDYRSWSGDLRAMERRIAAVFEAAGVEEQDVTLVGYSQGAERAERLAAAHPETFTRVVLIASPVDPSPAKLAGVEEAVLMSGTLDGAFARMKKGAATLRNAHIRATFFAIPGARHGEMGEDPEETFRQVFAWLDEGKRARIQ
jgi:pimeloyl-ACP methyl ester carboxylesterase